MCVPEKEGALWVSVLESHRERTGLSQFWLGYME